VRLTRLRAKRSHSPFSGSCRSRSCRYTNFFQFADVVVFSLIVRAVAYTATRTGGLEQYEAVLDLYKNATFIEVHLQCHFVEVDSVTGQTCFPCCFGTFQGAMNDTVRLHHSKAGRLTQAANTGDVAHLSCPTPRRDFDLLQRRVNCRGHRSHVEVCLRGLFRPI
jgi:hypothetical protein